VRRLLLLVSTLVLVDTMLYAALTPLLPHFARTLHLSKAGAGVLMASYAAGALLGGLPGGRAAARLGPRRAVLTGLTLMGISGVAFAFADSFGALLAARVVQGAGSAFTWAGAFSWLTSCAPPQRRGEMIGRAMGAAVTGELLGPVIGVISSALGRSVVFSAVAGLSIVLGVLTVQVDIDSKLESVEVGLRSGLRQRSFLDGLLLLAIGSTLFGVLSVLAPLHLAAAGWGTAAIGGVWLLGSGFEASESPFVGRLSDARGAMTPARLALLASIPVSLALATDAAPGIYVPLMVLAGMSYGALFTPSFSLVSEGAERAGIAQGMGFGLMNAAWAVGAMAGAASGGAIAGATGDSTPFILVAVGCAVAFLLFRRRDSSAEPVAVQAPLS
jgi:predicted MFS family arabinose efflux permease